eukprot:5287139-Prymnesium_polylepis.2
MHKLRGREGASCNVGEKVAAVTPLQGEASSCLPSIQKRIECEANVESDSHTWVASRPVPEPPRPCDTRCCGAAQLPAVEEPWALSRKARARMVRRPVRDCRSSRERRSASSLRQQESDTRSGRRCPRKFE